MGLHVLGLVGLHVLGWNFFLILHVKENQMVKPEFKEYINLPFNKWLLFKVYRYASFVG